jgi:hypothetical protein
MIRKTRPGPLDLLGWKEITGKDTTGNAALPPSQSPDNRTKSREQPSLDQFSPGFEKFAGDPGDYNFSLDDDDLAISDEVEESQFVNSQLDPVAECPSTQDPTRFTHKPRKG